MFNIFLILVFIGLSRTKNWGRTSVFLKLVDASCSGCLAFFEYPRFSTTCNYAIKCLSKQLSTLNAGDIPTRVFQEPPSFLLPRVWLPRKACYPLTRMLFPPLSFLCGVLLSGFQV